MLGIKEIQEIIPHRHPFLLIDCIEELEPGIRAVGYKCVTFHEDFFKGHFPGEPVTPGVCILQIAQELLSEETELNLSLKKIKNAKFTAVIAPNNISELIVTFSNIKTSML